MTVFVELGPMGYSSDRSKADPKYAAKAKDRLQKAAEKAVSGKATISKKDVPRYVVRLHVDEVKVDAKGVSCKLGGELNQVNQYSKNQNMNSTKLTGTGSIAGDNSEDAVYDCIAAAAATTMTKSILPNLK